MDLLLYDTTNQIMERLPSRPNRRLGYSIYDRCQNGIAFVQLFFVKHDRAYRFLQLRQSQSFVHHITVKYLPICELVDGAPIAGGRCDF
mgnify:CR=1 FL=1